MEDVSLFEALTITIVSMIVVFIVLVLISYLIGILKSFGQKNKIDSVDSATIDEPREVEEVEEVNVNKEELVAVISAVIAANMGLDAPEIKVQKIRKIDNSIWNETARVEQMN